MGSILKDGLAAFEHLIINIYVTCCCGRLGFGVKSDSRLDSGEPVKQLKKGQLCTLRTHFCVCVRDDDIFLRC